MHTTEDSIRLIEPALTVELMAFSPDGDPFAMVSIAKPEALALIAMPVTMGHVFRASHVGAGRVFVEAIEADGQTVVHFFPTISHAQDAISLHPVALGISGNPLFIGFFEDFQRTRIPPLSATYRPISADS